MQGRSEKVKLKDTKYVNWEANYQNFGQWIGFKVWWNGKEKQDFKWWTDRTQQRNQWKETKYLLSEWRNKLIKKRNEKSDTKVREARKIGSNFKNRNKFIED